MCSAVFVCVSKQGRASVYGLEHRSMSPTMTPAKGTRHGHRSTDWLPSYPTTAAGPSSGGAHGGGAQTGHRPNRQLSMAADAGQLSRLVHPGFSTLIVASPKLHPGSLMQQVRGLHTRCCITNAAPWVADLAGGECGRAHIRMESRAAHAKHHTVSMYSCVCVM